MAKLVKNNPLVRLLQSVTDVVGNLMGEKERAIPMYKIWGYAQKQLDLAAASDYEQGGYVLDVYMDDAGVFVVVTKNDGKMYKAPVTVMDGSAIEIGEYQEVVMDFKPVTTGRSLTVRRTADGKIRWFAMPACTAVLNRSGEIDSRALFDTFVDYIERTDCYPELDFFHLGEELAIGRADWVARDGYTYCASGLFYETDIARAVAAALEEDPDYWGLSIAYLPTSEPEVLRSADGIEIPVFNAGINRFISVLPEDTAASIMTAISTKEEVNRMKPEIKAALLKVAGTDESLIGEIDQLEERVDSVNRSTEDMIKRNVPAAPKAPAAKTAVKEPVAPPYRTPAPIARAAAPAPKAADRSEDIKALLGAPEFKVVLKDVMREVVSELMPAPAAAAANDDDDEKVEGGEEPTEEGTEETPADGAQATPADVVLAEIRALNKKVDGLTQDSKQRVADMLADLPSKIANEKVFRPRATRMPATLRQRDSMDLSAIAEETLAKIGDNE